MYMSFRAHPFQMPIGIVLYCSIKLIKSKRHINNRYINSYNLALLLLYKPLLHPVVVIRR
jgi:hypothetical protein